MPAVRLLSAWEWSDSPAVHVPVFGEVSFSHHPPTCPVSVSVAVVLAMPLAASYCPGGDAATSILSTWVLVSQVVPWRSLPLSAKFQPLVEGTLVSPVEVVVLMV